MILSELSGLSRKPPPLAKNYPVDDFLLGGGSTSLKEIMEYLEAHSTEIDELCLGYCWEDRKINNKEENI